MASANEQVVRDAVKALTTGAMDDLGALLADDVALKVPGSNQLSGDYKGKASFLDDFLGKIMGITGGAFQLEPHDFASSDDHVVGMYTLKATRDGKEFSWNHVNVYHVRDGKIAEIWQHPGDTLAWNDFWS